VALVALPTSVFVAQERTLVGKATSATRHPPRVIFFYRSYSLFDSLARGILY